MARARETRGMRAPSCTLRRRFGGRAAVHGRVAYRHWLRLWTLLASYELARGSTRLCLTPARIRLALPPGEAKWFAQPWIDAELKAAVDRLADGGLVLWKDDDDEGRMRGWAVVRLRAWEDGT